MPNSTVINSNKRIGRVVFLVEGDEDEPRLLRNIFHRQLGYHVTCFDKRNGKIADLPGYGHSHIFVIPMKDSALALLPGQPSFFDAMYHTLKEHGLHFDEAFIYYLFDRDRKSNTVQACQKVIQALDSPLDNGEEMAGALLLSYPSLQAVYCLGHHDFAESDESENLKAYVGNHRYLDFGLAEIKATTELTIQIAADFLQSEYKPDWFSHYSDLNQKLFEGEEKHYASCKRYRLIAAIAFALLDLGIVEIN